SSCCHLDFIITQWINSLEGADQVTRRSHAQLVGHILSATQIERAVSPPEPHKVKKDTNAEQRDDDDMGTPSAAAEVTKPMSSPSEMLIYLSTHFKTSAHHR
ncbi:hypothetical protein CVT24_002461, partial [Panaeolus cyanescens]